MSKNIVTSCHVLSRVNKRDNVTLSRPVTPPFKGRDNVTNADCGKGVIE